MWSATTACRLATGTCWRTIWNACATSASITNPTAPGKIAGPEPRTDARNTSLGRARFFVQDFHRVVVFAQSMGTEPKRLTDEECPCAWRNLVSPELSGAL